MTEIKITSENTSLFSIIFTSLEYLPNSQETFRLLPETASNMTTEYGGWKMETINESYFSLMMSESEGCELAFFSIM